jgi:hypothetical protein
VWTALSVLVTLSSLRTSSWSATVFTSAAAAPQYDRWLRPHAPRIRIGILEALSHATFDTEDYNRLLKSPTFWKYFTAPRVLVIQDDGMIVRRGLEDDAELLSCGYVGAPWPSASTGPAAAHAAVLRDAGVPESLVGNGGLSLRNTGWTLATAEAGESDGGSRRLYNHDSQPVPEDVFFSSAPSPPLPCPRSAAERFSVESRVPPPGVRPFGFHKPWAYLRPSEWEHLFADLS